MEQGTFLGVEGNAVGNIKGWKKGRVRTAGKRTNQEVPVISVIEM